MINELCDQVPLYLHRTFQDEKSANFGLKKSAYVEAQFGELSSKWDPPSCYPDLYLEAEGYFVYCSLCSTVAVRRIQGLRFHLPSIPTPAMSLPTVLSAI